MHNFNRALKLALAHRVNVVACVFTSAVIAVLWGGNLTAVFPVVEVIMNDHSLPDWIDQKIAESQTEVDDSHRWLAQLEKLQGQRRRRNPADRSSAEIDRREAELDEHTKEGRRRLGTMCRSPKRRGSTTTSSISKRSPKLPPEHIADKVDAGNQRDRAPPESLHTRAEHFRWIAPAAHRWLPTTPFGTLWSCACSSSCARSSKACSASGTASPSRDWACRSATTCGCEFYAKVLRLDMANFTESGRGDIMNRCTTDLNSISQGVQRLFGQALLEPLKVDRLPRASPPGSAGGCCC